MQLCAVILDAYSAPPTEKLAILFQAVCGWPRTDAMTRAARARGIVAERLPHITAQRLQEALQNLGFSAAVIDQRNVLPKVRARRVQLLLPEREQLGVRWTLTAKPQWYRWADVAVVSAGVVFHEDREQVIETEAVEHLWPRHAMELRTEIKHRDTSRDIAMATISLGSSLANMEHLRIRAPEVEYSTVFGEASRPSALENFCLLLARVGLGASQALITPETVELISAANASPRLPKEPRFASETDFDDYQRWLLVRHAITQSGPIVP